LANSNGIEVPGSSNSIGGTVTGTRNVLSGNSGDGVLFDNGATGNLVQGRVRSRNCSSKQGCPG
jgi:hypothetical protein